MTLLQLAVLSAGGVGIGIFRKRGVRKRLIVISSILVIYWLQPVSAVRYLGFWLPTGLLGLVVWVYAVIFPEKLNVKENAIDAGLILGTVLMVGGMRYLGPLCCISSTLPPRFLSVVLFVVAAVIVSGLLYYFGGKRIYLHLSFFLIIGLFLFLKNDALAEQLSRLLRSITGQNPELAAASEIVWLGYSYVAFRLLHVLRDKQNDRLPDFGLAEFAAYVLFFPSFTAGPIDRVQHFVDELRENKVLDADRFIQGTERLAIGVFKKFVLADSLALISLNSQNAGQVTHPLWGWVILYAYAFRILLDFAGYTDIAIGIGIYAGIKLPENFKKPYTKTNITEFWNNWHITLTQWFRAYFFYPLSRKLRSVKKLSTSTIIFVCQFSTMVLIGLWHGVSWNFVIWGAWHGLGLFFHNRWGEFVKRSSSQFLQDFVQGKTVGLLSGLLTFHYVALGWIWFVLSSPVEGWGYLTMLFGGL